MIQYKFKPYEFEQLGPTKAILKSKLLIVSFTEAMHFTQLLKPKLNGLCGGGGVTVEVRRKEVGADYGRWKAIDCPDEAKEH